MNIFDNSYARQLPGFYAACRPAQVPAPVLVKYNQQLADELGLRTPWSAAVFAGNELPDGAEPIAQAYAGHQFGGFSPSLGDGRALLLGEIVDVHGQRRDIAFKGSGRTAFSRGGDGKAAVGPVLREYLISEAMHALSIPATRTLAAALTGETIYRERPEPGAVLTRVAASHIRIGTFEYFAARSDVAKVRQLADYVIARHDPALVNDPQRYLNLLQAVAERQARLIAQWMNVGFIHGVMNTDNMTISGETIDFGPCAFMESHNPRTVFSSIDSHGRYAYGNQPQIARWNLARFAETLLPLIHEQQETAIAQAVAVIDDFPQRYQSHWQTGMRAKLGLSSHQSDDAALAQDWLTLLETQAVDFTLGWRHLADAAEQPDAPHLHALCSDPQPLHAWLARWRERCATEAITPTMRAAGMRAVNPMYIPRNHKVEEALSAARDGNLQPFETLLDVLSRPFTDRSGLEAFAQPAAAEVTAAYQTFCGT